MSSTIEKWSVHHLKSLVDYLDDASLLQLTQTALNLSTPEEVAAHFTSFLGDDPRAYSFVSDFNARRFPPSTRASVPSKRAQNQVQPGTRHDQPTRTAESKGTSRKPVGNTTLTSDLGVKSKSKHHQQQQQQQKVKKVDALTEIDAALRQLELDAEKDTKKQVTCDCAARRHGLNTVTPNCLSCGKIVCTLESFSKCSFCGADLLSRGQREAMIHELKRERGVESALAKQQPKRASAGTAQKVAYAGKVGGNDGQTIASRMDEQELRDKTQAAEQRKNELLEHVRSGYRRTVIDQASDYTTQSTDKWASPAERALALRRAQAAMHADDDRGRVISLSLSGGKATIKNEKRERRTEDEVDAGIAKEQRKIDEEKRREEEEQERVNQSYTRNKLMGSLGKLTFSAPADGTSKLQEQDWWTRGQKGWTRVQDYDDDEDHEQDARQDEVLSSIAMDGQAGRAEELGTSKRA